MLLTLPDDDILARLVTLDAPLGWITRNDVADVLRDADARIAQADLRVETVMRRLSFVAELLLPWRKKVLFAPHDTTVGLASRKAREVMARGYLPPAQPHPLALPELRVAHLGVSARFASLAPHINVTEENYETVLDNADVLLIEPFDDNPNMQAAFAPVLLAAAKTRGVATVVVFTNAPADSVWHDAGHVVTETGANAENIGLSIDTSLFNPVGFQTLNTDPLLAVTHTAQRAPLLHATDFTPRIVTLRGSVKPDVATHMQATVGTPHGLKHAFRKASVLADLPELRHNDSATAARLVLAAVACGLPVVTTTDTHAGLSPAGVIVTDTFTDTVHRLVDDVDQRERVSITARRQVLTTHSRLAAFQKLLQLIGYPLPKPAHVTVLLATNRPTFVNDALARIAAQNYAHVDVSLVLHGDTFDTFDLPEHALVSAVTRAPNSWTLGSCLNAALDQAHGTFVAKMDDDDHYGPQHLNDLLLAHGYAQADIVGKQAEFVYLADRNITVKRPLGPSERRRSHVAGPTPLMRRELAATHRFLPLPRRVDSTLYARVIAAGGSVYATHARDFVLERRASGHTWTVDDELFETTATASFDGLAVDAASSSPR